MIVSCQYVTGSLSKCLQIHVFNMDFQQSKHRQREDRFYGSSNCSFINKFISGSDDFEVGVKNTELAFCLSVYLGT